MSVDFTTPKIRGASALITFLNPVFAAVRATFKLCARCDHLSHVESELIRLHGESYQVFVTPTTTTTTTTTTPTVVPESPDWISSTFTPSATSMSAETVYTGNRDHRYRYRVSGSTTDQYSDEDTSTGFSTHGLGLSGLISDTEYQIWPQSRDSSTGPWYDMAGPFSEATEALGGWVSIIDSDWQTTGIDRSTLSSDWTGDSGFVSDSGNTDAYKVVIPYDENYGVSKYIESLPAYSQDVEFRFRMLVPAGFGAYWKQQDANIKLPGLCGKVSTLNGGYGGSQGTHLDNIYRAPSARKQIQRPSSSYQDLALGKEKYWQGSTNGPKANNSQGVPKYNGDSKWDSANGSISGANIRSATEGGWVDIRQRMVMNTPNNADGAIYNYIDGLDGYIETGIEWVKPFPNWQQFMTDGKLVDWTSANEMMQVYRPWFDVYHGGGDKVTAGDLVLFFRDFQYKVNA